jgi:hypothetical protein
MTPEQLARMKAPGDQRRGIWRGGILQIMVTRACDLACHHCTQGSNLAGKPAMMTIEQFDEACQSLAGYFGVIGVFGGNPALHPQFDRICQVMRARFPFEQRGLWCNNLRDKGAHARITFNPRHSNLNVHLDADAAAEIRRDWPEASPFIKGETDDSLHGSPWVSMTDLGVPENIRDELISQCDINQHWSAMICVVRGELRAFFCEIAGAQAMLHQNNPDWAGTGAPMPDTGLKVEPGWWRQGMKAFAGQVAIHCHHCGIPLRRAGQMAIGGQLEEFSATHVRIARPKVPARPVHVVTIGGQRDMSRPATDYLPGLTPRNCG